MIKITIRDISDYGVLLNYCNITLEDNTIIEINLKLDFINPHDVLFIVQTYIWIRNKNDSIRFKIAGKNKLNNYLTDIGLREFVTSNYKQPKAIEYNEKITAMPIRRVDRERLEEYALSTDTYLKRFCEGKDLTLLSIGIKESINNAYDHSNSKIGAYVFCQYYPTKRLIKLCVADFGEGIPNIVRKKHRDFSDDECLKWALIERNTTKSLPYNIGMGLATIKSFTTENKGILRIITGDCDYRLTHCSERFSVNPINNFKGTLIELEINIDELEHEELINESF